MKLVAPAGNRWRLYEILKQEWAASNPGATPEQYQAAMRRIAARCGV